MTAELLAAALAAASNLPGLVAIRIERIPGVTEVSTGIAVSPRHVATLSAFVSSGETPYVESGDGIFEPESIFVCPDLGIAILSFDGGRFPDVHPPCHEAPAAGDAITLVGQGVTGVITLETRVARQHEDGALLLSAPITEGLMGACAFDGEGRFVGLVNGIITTRPQNMSASLTEYFALVPTQMWYVWAELAMEGSPRSDEPFGVTATSCGALTTDDRPAGVLIVAVDDGSIASRCGLRPGDIIIDLGTVRTYHPESVRGLLMQAGDSLDATVWSRGTRRVLSFPPLR